MRSVKLKYAVPALLGITLMVTGLALGVYLMNDKGLMLNDRAAATNSVDPKEMSITNVRSDGFTVSWLTEEPVTGYLLLVQNDSGQEQVFRDVRDNNSKSTLKSTAHYVDVNSLKSASTYNFYIYSQAIRYDNGGSAYQVITAKNSETGKQAIQITGKVVTANKEPAANAIVTVNAPGMATQSVMTDQVGVWKLNLAQARNSSLEGPAIIPLDSQLTIKANLIPGTDAVVMIGANQLSELPVMVLGQSYDLTIDNGLAINTAPQKSKFQLAPELGAQGVANKTLTVWNPQDNEILTTNRPLFIGTAPADAQIDLTLTQPQRDIKASVTANNRGNWQWSPNENLSVGVHTLSAKLASSTLSTQSRFTVSNAIGSGPSFESSPSAVIAQATTTPTKVPTVAATATPTKAAVSPTKAATISPTSSLSITPKAGTVTPTVSPTKAATVTPTTKLEVSPTTTPTTAVTASPTQKMELTPTPTKVPAALPVAGNSTPTLILGLGIIVILGAGIILLR